LGIIETFCWESSDLNHPFDQEGQTTQEGSGFLQRGGSKKVPKSRGMRVGREKGENEIRGAQSVLENGPKKSGELSKTRQSIGAVTSDGLGTLTRRPSLVVCCAAQSSDDLTELIRHFVSSVPVWPPAP
jgi:hypothetical protein